jgi:glucan phosphorylase
LPEDRGVTGQLYGGDWENRLKQELLLGFVYIDVTIITLFKDMLYLEMLVLPVQALIWSSQILT